MQPSTYYRLVAVFQEGSTVVLRTSTDYRYLHSVLCRINKHNLYPGMQYALKIDWQGIDSIWSVNDTGEPI